ncbi:MAG TPA: preprotein translocase subunit YajC [Spirochaetota bacterium]|nr:preprotein translocase subunit YajC [Spirochaetota bacterium]HOM38696.1 preprotein translocase subunit YajC [Spirochaetota bacterium]HPQ49788.1 preprotein translocase subunit YajC [Spirochaetota bacterium]
MDVMLAQNAPQNSGIVTLIMMAAIFAIFYFLLIRPQQKRQKELQKQIQAIKKGDKVVTAGGIKGVVEEVKDETIVISSQGTKIEVLKPYIGQVLKS